MTTIENSWITLQTLKKGVQVQRKFAGLDTFINHEQNAVDYCIVKYWERELYPNGDVIKTTLKNYTLQDLEYTELLGENEQVYYMDALPVLTGFIMMLGYNGIINPSRETLENHVILPIDIENGYPLRRDTREKILKEG